MNAKDFVTYVHETYPEHNLLDTCQFIKKIIVLESVGYTVSVPFYSTVRDGKLYMINGITEKEYIFELIGIGVDEVKWLMEGGLKEIIMSNIGLYNSNSRITISL